MTRIGARRLLAAFTLLACCSVVWSPFSAASGGREGALRLDRAFAGRGFLFNSQLGRAQLAKDAQGRLLLAGSSNGEFVVVRYRPNGHPDRSFGSSGAVHIAWPPHGNRPVTVASVRAVAVAPDGEILLGGYYNPTPGTTDTSSSGVLVALKPNGAIDASFGGARAQGEMAGRIVLPAHEEISAIAMQGGRILVGGSSGSAFLGRFKPQGSLDRSFGRGRLGGWVRLPPRSTTSRRRSVDAGVEGLLAAPGGGAIFAAGYDRGRFLLAKLKQNGTLDHGFGSAGLVEEDVSRRADCGCSIGEGLARDRRGRLLVSGTILNHRLGFGKAVAVARYLPDGRVDRSFGRGGVSRTAVGAESVGGPLALQPGGGILIAAASSQTGHNSGPYRFTLLRYLPDGRADRGFFDNGVYRASFGAYSSEAGALVVEGANRVAVSGGAEPSRSARGMTSALLAQFSSR